MSTAIMTSHVRLDERGVAWLDDTNIKVVEVAMEQLAHGSSPEEIYEQHRGYLSLAQIHAALTYYYERRVFASAADHCRASLRYIVPAELAPWNGDSALRRHFQRFPLPAELARWKP